MVWIPINPIIIRKGWDMKGVSMCKAVESFIQEGKAEGLAEGKAEGKAEGIAENQKNNVTWLLKQGILTIEQIAEGLEIPLEEVLKIKEEISSQN